MLDSEDTLLQELDNRHSSLILLPRLSNLTITQATHLTFQTTEETTNSQSLQPTQDGGRSSSMKEANSSTSATRKLLMYKQTKMLKDKRLLFIEDITVATRDGR
jgi:hypothetical protein